MANYIKYTQTIKGIKIGRTEIKIGQYADDTFLTVEFDEKSIKNALSCFKTFENISGLKINVDKTQVVKLGGDPPTDYCPFLNVTYVKKFKLLGINFSTNLLEMDEINFLPKIINMQNIMKKYGWQTKTISGRIAIIKMYILPTFIHLLQVLPSPKLEYVTEINKKLRSFIWHTSKAKVRENVLIQDYEHGGKKMTHLESLLKASKLTWIRKMNISEKESSWKIVLKAVFNLENANYIFEGSINFMKNICMNVKNRFWKEVLTYWIEYRLNIMKLPESDAFQNTVIWNTEYIQNTNLTSRKNEFIEKGLIYFKHLYDHHTQSTKDCTAIYIEYGIKLNFLDYRSLIKSIPKDKLVLLKNDKQLQISNGVLIHDICSSVKPCKHIYWKYIEHSRSELTCKNKWQNALQVNISDIHWSNIFIAVNKTADSKLRDQYKIIHRILPTNRLLYLYKIKNSPFCDECTETEEDLIHLFYSCPKKLKLWENFANALSTKVNMYPYVNAENIILGIYDETKDLENTLILLVKRYIFINKSLKREITIKILFYFLNRQRLLETNAINLRQKAKNEKKWSTLGSLFQNLNMSGMKS